MDETLVRQKFISNFLKVATGAVVQPALLALGSVADTSLVMAATSAGGYATLLAGCLLVGSKLDADDHNDHRAKLVELLDSHRDGMEALRAIVEHQESHSKMVVENALVIISLIEERASHIDDALNRQQSLSIYIGEWLAAQGSEVLQGMNKLLEHVGRIEAKIDASNDLAARPKSRRIMQMSIAVPYESWGTEDVQHAVEILRLLSEDFELQLIRKENGSVKLIVEITENGLERLRLLERSGLISRAMGAFIESISVSSTAPDKVKSSPNSHKILGSQSSPERITFYVGNLPYEINDVELADLFSSCGEVVSARIMYDRETGRSRGFAFVELETDGPEGVIEAMNGMQVEGRSLVVNESRPRERYEDL
mgnify:CR=1 FL=1